MIINEIWLLLVGQGGGGGEMNVSNRRVVGVTLPQWSAWETLLENALVKRRPGGSRIVSRY